MIPKFARECVLANFGAGTLWRLDRGSDFRREVAEDVKGGQFEATLSAALEKTLNSKEHQQKAEQLSLEPLVMKGDQYRKFLKDNEQSTKKLMGW